MQESLVTEDGKVENRSWPVKGFLWALVISIPIWLILWWIFFKIN